MRIALTGAATGIGAAVASKLKSAGHEITAFDISAPTGNIDQWIKVDLSDPGSIEDAIQGAEGSFDALINNAGVPPIKGNPALVLNINFMGFRHFLEGMLGKLSSGASIVNTASRAGARWRDNIAEVKELMALGSADQIDEFVANRGMDHVRAYNLSKEAVIVYTMARTEALIAQGYRMNTVSPAAVSTGILDDFVSAFGEIVAKNIARVGRPGKPEEVADIIAFLASPQSGWLKGIDIAVDGGMGAVAVSDMMELGQAN